MIAKSKVRPLLVLVGKDFGAEDTRSLHYMKKCPYCSEPVPEKAAICPACAEPLGGKESDTPMPASRLPEGRCLPPTKRGIIKLATRLALFLLALALLAYHLVHYRTFTNQLTEYNGIRIGHSRAEVKYRLGIPRTVRAPIPFTSEDRHIGYDPYIGYRVNASADDKNKMPANTGIDDYNEWEWGCDPPCNIYCTIIFNKASLVQEITLLSDVGKPFGWGPIAGLYNGDGEDEVLRLGRPSKQELRGLTKTIDYDVLGLQVNLAKGKAYCVNIRGIQQNSLAVFWRYICQ